MLLLLCAGMWVAAAVCGRATYRANVRRYRKAGRRLDHPTPPNPQSLAAQIGTPMFVAVEWVS